MSTDPITSTEYSHPKRSRKHDHSSSGSSSASGSDSEREESEESDRGSGEESHPHRRKKKRSPLMNRAAVAIGVLVVAAGLVIVVVYVVRMNSDALASSSTPTSDTTAPAPAPTSEGGAAATSREMDATSKGGTAAATGTDKPTKTTAATEGGSSPTAVNTAVATAPPPGDASALAASFSLTPAAKLASLPFPTAAIEAAGDAEDYMKTNWNLIDGHSDFISFVADPFGGDGMVLQVLYPKGHYAGSGADGGIINMLCDVFGTDATTERAMVSYEVGFSAGFDFVKGGKLPGLFGGDPTLSCSGGNRNEKCFSLRLMFRTNGEGEVYGYTPIYDGFCEDETEGPMECNAEYGNSIGRGSWSFVAGQWNSVSEVAILNSDPEQPSAANGQLYLYNGDKLAIDRDDMVFRLFPDVYISTFYLSTFFGGSSSSFAASADCYAYFRNVQFYAGADDSDTAGTTVTASLP